MNNIKSTGEYKFCKLYIENRSILVVKNEMKNVHKKEVVENSN